MLLARVERINKPALIQLSNEAQIDEIFRFDGARLGVFLSQSSQNSLESLDCRILFARKLILTDVAGITLLHAFLIPDAAKVFRGDFQSCLAIGLDAVDGFHMRFYIPANNVRLLCDIPSGGGDASMLKGQAESRHIRK